MTPREQAESIGREFNGSLEAIRADQRLSDEGRRREIAALYTSTAEQMKAIRDEQEQEMTSEIHDLEEALLSPHRSKTVGVTVDRVTVDAGFRDALARAAATDVTQPSELADLLVRAHRWGDDLQVRAAAVITMERGHDGILQTYSEVKPEVKSDLQRLYSLRKNQEEGGLARLLSTGAYLAKPREIETMTDGQIARYASETAA